MFRFLKRNRQPDGLQGGDLSSLSQAACDDVYVQRCFEGTEEQQFKFATILCLFFYRCAEVLVKKIEQDPEMLEFYATTSRDVLVFESFLFYQYLVSESVREYAKDDWQDSFDHYTSLAAQVGTSLAKERVGEFDAEAHRERRLKWLLKYRGDAKQVTETFCGVLLCSTAKHHIDDPDGRLSLDLEVNLKVRQIAHATSSVLVRAARHNILHIYNKYFDLDEYERED